MSDIYRSATIKLTAWYLALVVAVSLIFSGVVYHFATDVLAQGLTQQQARIYKAFPVFNNNPFFVRDYDVATGARRILRNLVYFNIGVFALAGVASYWLARRTLAPIEQANERQKRFVADASHELRTPLTALKMSTEVALLDTGASKAELRAALESNREDSARLSELLNSLLRLSQLDASGRRPQFAAVPLADIAARALAAMQPRADAKHITITQKIGSETAEGDAASLARLLGILLDNAIKYSPEDSTVSLRAARQPHAVTLSVADHGIGIEPDALRHVFDRFYRADTARRSNDGYGLGLSIAKQIAEQHHGHITLSSRPGKGTTATLTLPSSS